MQLTIDPPSEPITMCGPLPLWLAPQSRPSGEKTGAGRAAEPVPPSVGIVDRIPPADFDKKKTGRAEGQPFGFLIEPVDAAVERIVLSQFAPKEQMATVVYCAKFGKICGPQTEGPAALLLSLQSGQADRSRRPPGGRLTLPPPVLAEPRIETKVWSAPWLRPSEPLSSSAAYIPFELQAGSSSEVRRPKQALRELVQPSPRPWHALTILWQSFRGFHLAMPTIEVASDTGVQTRGTAILWNAPTDGPFRGRVLLGESSAILIEREPSAEGACARLTVVVPVSSIELLPVDFNTAFRGSKPPAQNPDPFVGMVAETLPHPKSVEAPAPIIALSSGLAVWNGTINSYIRRNIWAPRLREGGRVIHTLRLAPVIQANESSEITLA